MKPEYFAVKPSSMDDSPVKSIITVNNPYYWSVWRTSPYFVLGEVVAIFPNGDDAKEYADFKNAQSE